MTADTLHSVAVSEDEGSGFLHRALREPLLHFLVLGALIFGLNAVIAPPIPPERIITLTPEIKKQIVDAFTKDRGHAPSPEELKPLLDTWMLNEITFREALAQGFDKGDEMIRERLTQKMSLLIFSNVTVPDPTPAQLQDWLDTHRARYDVPERMSFFEVPSMSKAEAEATLKLIDAGKEPESVRLRAHTFEDRPVGSLKGAFSDDFIAALKASPLHKWGVLPSGDAWHIVRLEAVVPLRHVDVEEVHIPLTDDWKTEQARARAVAEVREKGKSYVVQGLDQP